MKSFTLTLFVLLLALPLFSVVEPTNPEKAAALFELDEAEVEDAFTELDALGAVLARKPRCYPGRNAGQRSRTGFQSR
jgi:hypothetical protein